MRPIDCEHVRDLLPDMLSDRLEAGENARARAHLQSCADCRAELGVAAAVARARLSVPAGLQERIGQAVHGRVAVRPRWPAAVAASVAVAVIGSSALLGPRFWQAPDGDSAPPAADVPGAGWIGVDDAFMSGASSLRDLSVKELEQLLAELGS